MFSSIVPCITSSEGIHNRIQAFWRGSTTDVGWDPSVCQPDNGRRALVERWALSSDHRIDVGLSQLAQEANQTLEFRCRSETRRLLVRFEGCTLSLMERAFSYFMLVRTRREHWQHYVKAFRPVHDQVVYRYLVSVEGENFRSFFLSLKKNSLTSISCSFTPAQCRERERRGLRPQMDAGQQQRRIDATAKARELARGVATRGRHGSLGRHDAFK